MTAASGTTHTSVMAAAHTSAGASPTVMAAAHTRAASSVMTTAGTASTAASGTAVTSRTWHITFLPFFDLLQYIISVEKSKVLPSKIYIYVKLTSHSTSRCTG